MNAKISMNEVIFREKVLRDLTSITHDPLIIDSKDCDELQAKMRNAVERFVALHPDRVFRMIAPPEPRLPLGKWFERVFLLALKMTFPFSEVYHSVQDGRGGELDFVVRDRNRLIHIECSIKFFLYHPDLGSGLNGFIGPGGQDRLDLKLSKMQTIQLARQVPAIIASEKSPQRLLWMGGRLHFPLNHNDGISPDLTYVNPGCLKGFWATESQFSESWAPGRVLIQLPRQWWMTSIDGLTGDMLVAFTQFDLCSHLSDPIMVAEIEITDGLVREFRRGFLVPQGVRLKS